MILAIEGVVVLVFGRDSGEQTMLWVSSMVPGFQEARTQSRESRIRAVQQSAQDTRMRLALCRETENNTEVYFQRGFTLDFSLLSLFYTLLAPVSL